MKLSPYQPAILALMLLGIVPVSTAQIVLPPVSMDDVPLHNVPVLDTAAGIRGTIDEVVDTAEVRQLRGLRRLHIRSLLRSNRSTLEPDPRGAPIVRHEVAAFSPTTTALDRARAAGFSISRAHRLEGLEASIVILQAPAGMSTRRALQELRKADPAGVYDFNHVYTHSAAEGSTAAVATDTTDAEGADASYAGVGAGVGPRVGLIDGGVQKSHPAFASVQIHEHGCVNGIVPSAHGTAVASLIVGKTAQFQGAAPAAVLYAADVYCGMASGGAVDAISAAFAWMVREQVPVINISLVGPPNAMLEQVIRIVTAKGHLVVAAVGNDGPSAPPLYPAAYPDVVAVTGVDARNRALLEACRGKHVDFAAPGADMPAAGLEQTYALVRGTSFAAPLVAGLLAREVTRADKQLAAAALASLIPKAKDLGARGFDKVYGNGLVGESLRMPESLASTRP